ncbi:MAG: WD40/YVTN/BNR-like repeat-containing protein, partial [Ignavibacteriales bacterium]
MTTLIAGLQNSVLVIESSSKSGGWKTYESLKGSHPQGIAFDLLNPSRAYCGTFDKGLWKTDNGGQTWDSIGKNEISTSSIMSVSISPLKEGNNGFNKVYVGTEPSALYISSDGGESWERMSGLNNLESSATWSFPPRPWTHHVRWIEPDVNNLNYVFVAIEAGALVQSHDGGRTWIDRVKQGPYDTHTLATHRKMPKRLYSSAGDGYFESFDYGESWNSQTEGLRHHYLHGLAVDSSDPQNVIVSASLGAWQAHNIENANSVLYRRSADGETWKNVSKGLPESKGTIITMLASNPNSAGEFYALNNRGIFIS